MNKKEAYKERNEQFLADLRKEEGINELANGVLYKVLESGDSKNRNKVKYESIVTCRYKGSLIDGHVFDDAFERDYPETFRVYELINGFQIALMNMHVGDRWIVYIPAEQGYGSRNAGDIPGNSTLIFEIKLIAVAG